MDELVPIVAIISVFGSAILFISTLTNFALKKKLIEKNMVNEDTANMFKSMTSKQNALKWGLIALFGGLGLIIIEHLPYDEESTLPYGVEAVCISVGFLIYYFLVKKEEE